MQRWETLYLALTIPYSYISFNKMQSVLQICLITSNILSETNNQISLDVN